MFSNAIVRRPGKMFVNGLSSSNLGIPNYQKAISQHEAYVAALETCGLKVHYLKTNENFPDSTFVEDIALLTSKCAIIMNPGAPSRRGEIIGIKGVLEEFYTNIERIRPPGTAEAGDIMMVGNHFYIGLSARTNKEGARQIEIILNRYGMTSSVVPLKNVLHLKTCMAYLEKNNLLFCDEFMSVDKFSGYRIIDVPVKESYAANSIWVNETVIMPSGYPQTRQKIRAAGYKTIEVDVSEYRKLDGGLSCLSLRF